MKPGIKRGVPTRRILFSKTDALGDLLLATGLVHAALNKEPDSLLIWVVREGYEQISGLLDGSVVFQPDLENSPAREAAKALKTPAVDQRIWSRVLFVPTGIDPYRRQTDNAKTTISWWNRFVRRLDIETAVVGSTTRNWLDQLFVLMSQADTRIGFAHSPGAQKIQSVHLQGASGIPKGSTLTVELPFVPDLSERQRLRALTRGLTRKAAQYRPVIAPRSPLDPAKPSIRETVLGIAPGVGDPRRQVNPDSVCRAVVDFLAKHSEFSKRCALIEGPADRAIVAQFAQKLSALGIKTTRYQFKAHQLPELVSVLRDLALFLCHETFHVQLADILGTPTVALWGLGHWGRFFPESGKVNIVHTDMPCRGCGWNCCFDRWKCVSDLPEEAILSGLQQQWKQRGKVGISFTKSRPPVSHHEVLDTLKLAAFKSTERKNEIETLHDWIEHLRKEVNRLSGWGKTEQVLKNAANEARESAQLELDQARQWAANEKALRSEAETLLKDAERQRDDAAKAVREETKGRTEAEGLLKDAEAMHRDAKTWADEASAQCARLRTLLKDTERQRSDAETWAEKERTTRTELETRLRETETQRDDQKAWAQKEFTLRRQLEDLLRDADKQRDDATSWAEEESRAQSAMRDLLTQTENQRERAQDWAEQEKATRLEFEALLADTEQQRDDTRRWAEEEATQRAQLRSLLTDTEKQRDDATAWAKEERRLRMQTGDRLKTAENRLEQAQTEIRNKLNALDAKEAQLAREQAKVTTLATDARSLQDRLSSASAQIERADGQISILEGELELMKLDRDRYQTRRLCRLIVKASEWRKKTEPTES